MVMHVSQDVEIVFSRCLSLLLCWDVNIFSVNTSCEWSYTSTKDGQTWTKGTKQCRYTWTIFMHC